MYGVSMYTHVEARCRCWLSSSAAFIYLSFYEYGCCACDLWLDLGQKCWIYCNWVTGSCVGARNLTRVLCKAATALIHWALYFSAPPFYRISHQLQELELFRLGWPASELQWAPSICPLSAFPELVIDLDLQAQLFMLVLGMWTRVLMLVQQVITHWTTLPASQNVS